MNGQLALRRLWWKEMRQLMPILILLPVLVVLLLVLYALTSTGYSKDISGPTITALCFGMPGLFACGAGALLVGYEKELRTLSWLTSLPISSLRIVRAKVLVGLAGLACLWLVGLLMFAVASKGNIRWFTTSDVSHELTWLMNSLFILFAGFALAWWARSALVALLLVVPVATLPYLMAHVIDDLIAQATYHPDPRAESVLACQLIGIGLAWWMTERMGKRALAAQPPASSWSRAFAAPHRGDDAAKRVANSAIQPPLAALVWQFVRQSRAVLIGTSMMWTAAVVALATGNIDRENGDRIAFGVLLLFLAIAWLGVNTFQSDGLRGRIRFLADRGVSPRAVWLTRQAVPLGLLALFAVLLGLAGLAVAEFSWPGVEQVTPTIVMFATMAFLIYLVTQWFGQVVVSPTVCAIGAPLVALTAVGYGRFALEMLATPWWLALLVLPLPWVATWVMTRRWMDQSLGRGYWAGHGGFLAAACLLPAMPLVIAVVRQPTMPDDVAREIQTLAQQSREVTITSYELVLADTQATARPGEPMGALLDLQLDHLAEQLQASEGSTGYRSLRAIEYLRATASLTRLSLSESSGTDESTTAPDRQQALRQYRRSVEMTTTITRRMRMSPALRDQDVADLLEIWLLTEVRAEQSRERLGVALYDTIATMLGDRSGRRESRMRAIALSWEEYQGAVRRSIPTSLGEYSPDSLQDDVGTLKEKWVGQHRVGLVVADLWMLARGGEAAATPTRLARIAQFAGRPPGRYGIGPQGPFLRADDLEQFLHPPVTHSLALASQWQADWERLAVEELTAEAHAP